jgi:hypothetical protein
MNDEKQDTESRAAENGVPFSSRAVYKCKKSPALLTPAF